MKIFLSLIFLFFGFLSSEAFAIDQVKFNSGAVAEGQILEDKTNLFVDIRLLNGDVQRIPHSEIASIERDIPSSQDVEAYGNHSIAFASVLLGGSYDADDYYYKAVIFDYGVRIGVVARDVFDSKLAFAFSYDHASQDHRFDNGTSIQTDSYGFHDLNFQLLLMKIRESGFYAGPNFGLAIRTVTSNDDNDSATQRMPELGFGGGYQVFLSNLFSVDLDFRYEHLFEGLSNPYFARQSANVIKPAVGGSFHF